MSNRFMCVTGVILCGILVSIFLPTRAADLPSFDAASVKRSDPNNRSSASNVCTGGPGTSDPTTLRCTNAGLSLYVLLAYDVKFYEVICPNWVMLGGPNNGYDITAKIPAGTTKEQYRQMLQHLLADRFHMVVHRESRELPVYTLLPGKGRSKLTSSTTPAPPGPRVADQLREQSLHLEVSQYDDRDIRGRSHHPTLVARKGLDRVDGRIRLHPRVRSRPALANAHRVDAAPSGWRRRSDDFFRCVRSTRTQARFAEGAGERARGG